MCTDARGTTTLAMKEEEANDNEAETKKEKNHHSHQISFIVCVVV